MDAILLQEVGWFPFANEAAARDAAENGNFWYDVDDPASNQQHTRWHIYHGPHAGAWNIRCDNAILTRQEPGSSGLFDNSESGRAVPWVHINGYRVANIHATVGIGLVDLKAAMRQLIDITDAFPIVIGGDFNDLRILAGVHFQNLNSADRANGFETVMPNQHTHNNGILDGFALRGCRQAGLFPTVSNVQPSDHDPVFVSIL